MTSPANEDFDVSDHITSGELADNSAGLLAADRSADLARHLALCPQCAAEAESIAAVSEILAAEPTPTMPAAVFARLSGVVNELSRERVGLGASAQKKPSLGTFGEDLPATSKSKLITKIAVAGVAAAAIGLAGYVISSVLGLNEPGVASPIAVTSQHLAAQARVIEQANDLAPHLFSNAWSCAREFTEGKITGLVQVIADGSPGLLVYVEGPGDDIARVMTVTGCESGHPVAGPATPLPG